MAAYFQEALVPSEAYVMGSISISGNVGLWGKT
jgi:hypothetical protein